MASMTRMTSKEQALEALLAPTVAGLGCEIWGLEYRPWGRRRATLKLFIDAAAGITIEHCERVSRQVSALLDVEEPIAGAYRLEVSSPGLDRTLYRREHFEASVGEQVAVQLAVPIGGRRRIEGLLAGVDGSVVTVREGEGETAVPFGQIGRCRLVPSLPQEPQAVAGAAETLQPAAQGAAA